MNEFGFLLQLASMLQLQALIYSNECLLIIFDVFDTAKFGKFVIPKMGCNLTFIAPIFFIIFEHITRERFYTVPFKAKMSFIFRHVYSLEASHSSVQNKISLIKHTMCMHSKYINA